MAFRNVARVVRLKAESTYNTDPTTAQGDECRIWGPKLSPSFDSYIQECLDNQGAGLGATIGGSRTPFSFNTHFMCPNAADGDGPLATSTSIPEWAPAMQACGYQLVYTPEVGGNNAGSVVLRRADVSQRASMWADVSEDGRKWSVGGWRGGWKMTIKRGESIAVAYDGIGMFTAPTAVAVPATSATTVDANQPVVVGGANCLALTPSGGAAYYPQWEEITLDSGCSVTETPNGNAATMVGGIELTKPGPITGTIKMVAQNEGAVAPAHSWYAALRAGTLYGLVLTVGSVIQSRCSIALPYMVLTNLVEDGGEYGTQTLSFLARRDLATPNNDFTATFT